MSDIERRKFLQLAGALTGAAVFGGPLAVKLLLEKPSLAAASQPLNPKKPELPPPTPQPLATATPSEKITGVKDPKIEAKEKVRKLDLHIGVWIWQLAKAEGGDVNKIVEKAKAVGLGHILIDTKRNPESQVRQLIKLCSKNKIVVFGWQADYPKGATADANWALKTLGWGANGVIFDDEGTWKGNGDVAKKKLTLVRGDVNKNFPGAVIGYSSFAFPSLHPTFPFAIYNEFCHLAMPQVYWASWKKSYPWETTINKVKTDWKNCPIAVVPVGHAYNGTGGTAYIPEGEVERFVNTYLKEKDYTAGGYRFGFGLNFWRWELMAKKHWSVLG